jgi:hypothetical protein
MPHPLPLAKISLVRTGSTPREPASSLPDFSAVTDPELDEMFESIRPEEGNTPILASRAHFTLLAP